MSKTKNYNKDEMNVFNKKVSQLRAIASKSPQFVPEDYLDTLYALSEHATFVEFLNSIKNDEILLQEIASQSYMHHNGFDKLVLSTNFDLDWRLRMHIWWSCIDSSSEIDYDIHNHSWDYASVIVTGELTNEIFKVSEKGEKYYHHHYEIDDIKCEASLIAVGEVNLALENVKTYRDRETYFQTKEKLHRTLPNAEKTTITIIVQQKGQYSISDVYKKKQQSFTKSIGLSGTLITGDQIQNSINLILKEY